MWEKLEVLNQSKYFQYSNILFMRANWIAWRYLLQSHFLLHISRVYFPIPIRFPSQIKKHNIHILKKCCLSKSPPQFQANWIGYIRLLWIHCLPAISRSTYINKWNFRSLVFTFIVHYVICMHIMVWEVLHNHGI